MIPCHGIRDQLPTENDIYRASHATGRDIRLFRDLALQIT